MKRGPTLRLSGWERAPASTPRAPRARSTPKTNTKTPPANTDTRRPSQTRPPTLHPLKETLLDTLHQAKASFAPRQALGGFALALLVVGSGTGALLNEAAAFLQNEGRGEVVERAVLFGTILSDVREGYVEAEAVAPTPELDRLFTTGVNAMLSTLDPYTSYADVEEADDLATRTMGRYGGVGLTIGADADRDDATLVLGALEGYAYDVGVRPGDRIVSIDGAALKGLRVDEVKARLRGEPGSSVTVGLERAGGAPRAFELLLPRRLVQLPDVSLSTMARPGVGYVRLDSFSEHSTADLARAVVELQQGARATLQALVLDLRGNPGGLLDAAVGVSQLLVQEGTPVVRTEGRVYGEGNALTYRTTRPPLLSPDTRLVVLVNGGTASAAEIVAGAVQDTDRGVIVGERSFGKGLVQVVQPLPGGRTLKLTVAKYFTPSGRCIQAISYKPKAALAAAGLAPPPPTEEVAPRPKAPLGGSVAPPEPEAARAADAATAANAATTVNAASYTTLNGRTVRAGGGIAPDVEVSPPSMLALESSLIRSGTFLRFVDQWLDAHPGAPEAQQRALDAAPDAAYRDFVKFARSEIAKAPRARAASKAAEAKSAAGEKPTAAPEVALQDPLLSEELDRLATLLDDAKERELASRELRVLRKVLAAEETAQFESQRARLMLDLHEAVFTRLVRPSEMARSMLQADPQATLAIDLASDPSRYGALLQEPRDVASSGEDKGKPPPPGSVAWLSNGAPAASAETRLGGRTFTPYAVDSERLSDNGVHS